MTRQPIIPYHTVVKCRYCGHEWKPRSRHPEQCPRCWKSCVGDFDLTKLEELRAEIIKAQNN